MRTIRQFIDEALVRLDLDSQNKLAKAIGYKSSGVLSQIYNGTRGVPEEREDQWILVLRIPAEQIPAFRAAAAHSRANQKTDIRDDYDELNARADALDSRGARLEAAVRELVAFLKAKGIKLPKELLDRIKAALGD